VGTERAVARWWTLGSQAVSRIVLSGSADSPIQSFAAGARRLFTARFGRVAGFSDLGESASDTYSTSCSIRHPKNLQSRSKVSVTVLYPRLLIILDSVTRFTPVASARAVNVTLSPVRN